jgi:hypothetical protein
MHMKTLKLDFVQEAVLKHALQCLREEVDQVAEYRQQAQEVVINALPLRKRMGDKRTIDTVLTELLQELA